MPMIVKKMEFNAGNVYFENAGSSVPIKIGYETYGELNAARDNAILLCHYFTGTSHAAGKYRESDAAPGWWDAIIGPGKPFDINKYFIICTDVISNINANNPDVITTGPASINPATGRHYGMTFPVFSMKDVVGIQKKLVESMGIKKLAAICGPSMGGLQSFAWARFYPEFTDKIISVCAAPVMWPNGIMIPNSLGIEAIRLDPDWNGGDYYDGKTPDNGLLLAFKVLLMATRTEKWALSNFGRRYADPDFKNIPDPARDMKGRYLVETEIENIVLGRMGFFDANSYIYICRANMLFDVCEKGESLESGLSKICARTLMIIDDSDLIFTRFQAEETRRLMKDCECLYYNSDNGHLSCLYETNYFAERIRAFINGK